MSSIAESRNRGFFSSKSFSGAFKKHHNHHLTVADEELIVSDVHDEGSTTASIAAPENINHHQNHHHHHHHNNSSNHLSSPSFTSLLHPFKRRGSSRSITSVSSNDSANITSTRSNDSESAASIFHHHHNHHHNNHHNHHQNNTSSSDEEASTNVSSQKYSLKKFFRKPVVDTSDKSMELLLSKYGTLGSVLGVGAGGSVRLITRASDNRTFAVKEFRSRKPDESLVEYTKKCNLEYSVGSNLKHPNVIEVMDIISIPKSSHQFEVMEYCPYELFTVVMEANITRSEINCYFKQLCLGVQYLHSVGLGHRDLKLDNCVISAEGILKIIDFGSATVFSTSPPVACDDTEIIFSLGVHGSDPYLAPETLISNKFYDPRKADIWSIGIVYCCMTLKRFPWKVPDDSDYSFKMYSLPDDVERDYVKSAENHKLLLANRRKELLSKKEKEEQQSNKEVGDDVHEDKEIKNEAAEEPKKEASKPENKESKPENKEEAANSDINNKPKEETKSSESVDLEVKPQVESEKLTADVKVVQTAKLDIKLEAPVSVEKELGAVSISAVDCTPQEKTKESIEPSDKDVVDLPKEKTEIESDKKVEAIQEEDSAEVAKKDAADSSEKEATKDSNTEDAAASTKLESSKPSVPRSKTYRGSYRLMRLLPHASRPLISKVLTVDVDLRATMDDIFKDEWFSNIHCCSTDGGNSGHTHSLVSNKH